MNMNRFLTLSALASCTAIHVATMPCLAKTPRGYFTDVINVGPTSSVDATEFVPVVSPDGMTLYFSQSVEFGQQFPGGQGDEDIWMATRSNLNQRFANVTNLGASVNSPANDHMGSVSSNGLELYFGSNRSGNTEMYRATRLSVDEPFDNVMPLGSGVNTDLLEGSPRVSPDGLTLVYQVAEQLPVEDMDVWIATRDSTDLPFDDARPMEISGVGVDDWWPSLSADGLTLFVSDWVFNNPRPGGEGQADIWVSTRESTDEPFGAPVNLDELWPESDINTIDINGAAYISPDWPDSRSRLYWMGSGPGPISGSSDIFQATWVSLDGLQAGDANQDKQFDQTDLVQVQQSAKYLTGLPATWGEGDWNGAPGGEPGNPPRGDGVFDQADIIAALGTGLYLTGPYEALSHVRRANNGFTSAAYDASMAEPYVIASPEMEPSSIDVGFTAGVVNADPGDIEFVHVPEPASARLLFVGLLTAVCAWIHRPR